jgi:hypothetical protein
MERKSKTGRSAPVDDFGLMERKQEKGAKRPSAQEPDSQPPAAGLISAPLLSRL